MSRVLSPVFQPFRVVDGAELIAASRGYGLRVNNLEYLGFSADGRRAFTCGRGEGFSVRDAETGAELAHRGWPAPDAAGVRWLMPTGCDPEGRLVVLSSFNHSYPPRVESDDGTPPVELPWRGPARVVPGLAAAGRALVQCNRSTALVDLRTGAVVRAVPLEPSIELMSVDPAGRTALGRTGGAPYFDELCFVSLADGSVPVRRTLRQVRWAQLLPGGRRVAASFADRLEIVDLESGDVVFQRPEDRMYRFAVAPDGMRMIAQVAGGLALRDLTGDNVVATEPPVVSSPTCLQRIPAGVVVGGDRTKGGPDPAPALALLDESFDPMRDLSNEMGSSSVAAMALAPGGGPLAVAEPWGVRLLDPRTARVIASIEEPAIRALAFRSDGRLVTCGQRIALWRADRTLEKSIAGRTGTARVLELDGHMHGHYNTERTSEGFFHVLGGGRAVLSRWERQLVRTDVSDGSRHFVVGFGFDQRFASSADGRWAVAAAGETPGIRLLDLGEEQVRVTQRTGHSGATTALTISPDGRHWASAGREGRVLVWRLSAESPVVAIDLARAGDHAVALQFSADRPELLVATAGRVVLAFRLAL